MRTVQVLGPGCPSCQKLASLVEETAREIGVECEIQKITDIEEIVSFGVMATPALVVDGRVLVTGRVPGADELKKFLQEDPAEDGDGAGPATPAG
jgi:small redox-active disulfide protein 2